MRKLIHLITIAMALIAMATASEAKTPKKKPVAEVETFAEETMESAKLVVDPATAPKAIEAGATLPGEAIEAAAETTAAPVAALPKVEINKLPENEIPVLAQVKDAKKAEGGGFARLMATLGVLVVVLGGASFGLKRWMGKAKSAKTNTRIKVLTQHHLGPKKSLAIIALLPLHATQEATNDLLIIDKSMNINGVVFRLRTNSVLAAFKVRTLCFTSLTIFVSALSVDITLFSLGFDLTLLIFFGLCFSSFSFKNNS